MENKCTKCGTPIHKRESLCHNCFAFYKALDRAKVLSQRILNDIIELRQCLSVLGTLFNSVTLQLHDIFTASKMLYNRLAKLEQEYTDKPTPE